jgi:hypothetical protein
MKYRFTLDIRVQDINRKAGEVVDEIEIPAGAITRLQEMGRIVPVPVPENAPPIKPVEAPANAAAGPINKPSGNNKRR